MKLPYPMPKISDDLLYDEWCVVATPDYRVEKNCTPIRSPSGERVPTPYFPYGREVDGTPTRGPCQEVIIFQASADPASKYPANHANAMIRSVTVYTNLPKDTSQENLARFYSQFGWLLLVYPERDSEYGTAYVSAARAAIYDEHVEFKCTPME